MEANQNNMVENDFDDENGDYEEPDEFKYFRGIQEDFNKSKKEMENLCKEMEEKSKIKKETTIPLGKEFKEKYHEVLDKVKVKKEDRDEIKKLVIKLSETNTIHLFSLPSHSVHEDSVEVEEVLKYNRAFQKASEDKVIIRRMDRSVQTLNPIMLTKQAQTDFVEQKDKTEFASEWDMFDAYKEAERRAIRERLGIIDLDEDDEETAIDLVKLQEAVLFTERIMASNEYIEQQMQFHEIDKDRTRLGYAVTELWKFSNPEINAIGSANCLCWNPKNSRIIAVGYGQFVKGSPGAVALWSAKNPVAPERVFSTTTAITSLSFSATRPHLLTASGYDGRIFLFNTTSFSGLPRVINKDYLLPSEEPIWTVQWYMYSDGAVEYENVVSAGRAGQVWMWDLETPSKTRKLIQLDYYPPPGAQLFWKRQAFIKTQPQFTKKTFNVFSMSFHPSDRISYFLATDQGSVVQCEIQNTLKPVHLFLAHMGPVYGIKHAPYCDRVLATYGGDSFLRIWVKGIEQPLLELMSGSCSVEDMDWSPSHSTILAFVTREQLFMWDLTRKYGPSRPKARSLSSFTTVRFSPEGNNLLVGCSDGEVLVNRLSEMPQPFFLKRDALINALKKRLEERPDLQEKVSFALV